MSSALIERPGIAGRVMDAGEEIPYCSGDDGCLPPPDDLTRLAGQARRGRPNVPFVGLGHPDTMLTCVHGSWRLGDKVVRLSRRCLELRCGDCQDGTCECRHHTDEIPALMPPAADAGDGVLTAELMRQNSDLQRRLALLEARAGAICTGSKGDGSACKANVVPGTDRCSAHPRD